jgi:hypothetical protein
MLRTTQRRRHRRTRRCPTRAIRIRVPIRNRLRVPCRIRRAQDRLRVTRCTAAVRGHRCPSCDLSIFLHGYSCLQSAIFVFNIYWYSVGAVGVYVLSVVERFVGMEDFSIFVFRRLMKLAVTACRAVAWNYWIHEDNPSKSSVLLPHPSLQL